MSDEFQLNKEVMDQALEVLKLNLPNSGPIYLQAVKATHKDWIIFAVGVNGNTLLMAYGGPVVNPETNNRCAIECELDDLSDTEIIDKIEFDTKVPDKPGIYRWEGKLIFQSTTDWETGIVDNWWLVGKGEFEPKFGFVRTEDKPKDEDYPPIEKQLVDVAGAPCSDCGNILHERDGHWCNGEWR